MSAHRAIRRFIALALLAAPLMAQAARDGTVRFRGYAYDQASGKYAYTENHEQHWANGKWLSGSVTYTAPDGTVLARKSLDFGNDPYIPLVRTDYTAGGYVEAITDNRDPIVAERRAKTGAEMKSRSIERRSPMVADAGLGRFIVAHFDRIMGGDSVQFRLVAPSQLDTYKFRVQRFEDTTFEGRPAVQFRIELDSFLRVLAGLITGPIEVVYDPQEHHMLEFRGPSGLIDPKSGKRYGDVRVEYYTKTPADAPKNLR